VTDKLLDANEVAARLNVPVSWVRESVRSGAMPHIRLGRYVRFDWLAVEEWLATCTSPGRTIGLRSRRAA
jgi:excisionase family DNA binding protein